ncbi:complex I subunit 4 family protein [Candidatus Poriferisodalis sp.]|uniref:complex I subunit 4 family protein n=1 Tax=Candidatus Poriferisodalis sp. TaxID=3101277 RepID=UPI003B526AB0
MSTGTLLAAAGAGSDFPLLNALIFVPVVGALVVALLPRSRPDLARPIGTLFAAIGGALALALAWQFDTSAAAAQLSNGDAAFQFESTVSWIPALGISWKVGVDGISLWLVVLTSLIVPIVLAGVDPHHNPKPYTAWMLLLQAGSVGAFLALDLFLFFVMFEVVLVPMYLLIAGWGYEGRRYAATKFFIYTMAGSALLLVAIVATAVLGKPDSGITFDLVTLAEGQHLATNTARLCFVAFAIAFLVKVPVVPLHTWLPDAHTEAPTAGSVVLAAVLLKLGTYGLLRFGLYLFPEASEWAAPVLVTVGVVGVIWGAVTAAMQRDLKRLVAYSSVAHMGFIVLGIFAFTTQAVGGGVILMVNHGITTGALFLLVGMLYERRHTRQIDELAGIQSAAPVYAGVFTLMMLSSVGVPGLNGFVGEFLILIGSFETRRWWTVVAATGVILAALYLLWAYQRVFHGPPAAADRQTADLRRGELLTLAPFVIAVVALGVYPKPLLSAVEPTADNLLEHFAEHSGFELPAPDDPVEVPASSEHSDASHSDAPHDEDRH